MDIIEETKLEIIELINNKDGLTLDQKKELKKELGLHVTDDEYEHVILLHEHDSVEIEMVDLTSDSQLVSEDNSYDVIIPEKELDNAMYTFNKEVISITSEKEAYPCDLCDKKYKTPAALKRHVKTHDGKVHFCDVCYEGFNRPDNLQKHKKKFQCCRFEYIMNN